ncbi:hypothetical protein K1T71_000919 [Dendrolimus kikuchii]|uniref:Uncharacterized protein n=1 Tax=Dendrolimus kikuchii TaxID=765133 RepID=A0ACC1DG56_9NEOP|nr:hypothetical protein K1T71_000919 [Dendrolimus kikuchii]
MYVLPGACLIVVILYTVSRSDAKWVEGHIDTKDNWAFLSRFCFLSLEGEFEYLIEYDKEMGIPNLLLYYDDESQWPSVYHSTKTCKEKEAALNRVGQNQIIKLSHWYPDTEYSGCIITRANREVPALKSPTTLAPLTKSPFLAKSKNNTTKTTKQPSQNPTFYDQFLKTTTPFPKTPISHVNSTIWYELLPTEEQNVTTPDDELWENIGPENGTRLQNLEDVEILFDTRRNKSHKIKRSTFEPYERYKRRHLKAESSQKLVNNEKTTEKLVVSCHNSRRFRSARERWWFIAISNCESGKGLDVRYKFLMTNGPDGDFWHQHFSADEFYVLPVLLAYTFAYVLVMVAVVMCSVELKSRHLLHTTYKLFLFSIVFQHLGVLLESLGYIKYASNGVGSPSTITVGQFFCGVSEMTFLLLLVLMAKGYTITRGRLKVGFTVKLTVFMCCYAVTYIVLFVYQAKAFDPGEVLYLYESPAGYGLIVLRVTAWCAFAYSTFFTVRKYPEKNMFYCPFFICGTLWFYAGPLFILTANAYIDKWVRESVVTAVLLFITFSGHIMFLMLTLPVFANKNFPYHVRTTQIGVMEVTGNPDLDSFGHNAYHPSNGAPQTVIIPLTRRTEELIGNMYTQYMASAPPLSIEHDISNLNGLPYPLSVSPKNKLIKQESTDTNNSDDIKPNLPKEIFTVESQMSKIVLPGNGDNTNSVENIESSSLSNGVVVENVSTVESEVKNLPNVLKRRNTLEPIKRDEVPSWSLAKGPCVVSVQKKSKTDENGLEKCENPELNSMLQNGKKVPPVRNGLPSSGEISTIVEGKEQCYQNSVSKATIDLFNASSKG